MKMKKGFSLFSLFLLALLSEPFYVLGMSNISPGYKLLLQP